MLCVERLEPRLVLTVLIESGDFVNEVSRLKDLAFSSGSSLYIAPSVQQQTDFNTLGDALLVGNVAGADAQAAALGYEVVEFTDTVSGDVYHGLREQLIGGVQTKGWGSFFANLDFQSDALVEVPHPLFDTNFWDVGAKAFREADARGFLLAGAHRNANGTGTADVAHLAASIFQEVHQSWVGPGSDTDAWQVHGFDDANHSFPAGTDAVLSNGDGSVSDEVVTLDAELEANGFLTYAYNTLAVNDPQNVAVNGSQNGATFSSLGGTTNEQGIHSRSLGGIFVHTELEQSIRFDAGNRDLAAGDISDAIVASSSFLVAGSEILAVPGAASALIAFGSSWKYLDDGSDQGTAWTSAGFNDSAWASGSAQLGYGDGDETTVVSFGPDSNNKYATTYFRTSFNVVDASSVDALDLFVIRDDGVAVYLNGVEIMRDGLAANAVFNDFATQTISNSGESVPVNSSVQVSALPVGTLVNGNNILAVEMHQTSGTSSDISFDLQLETIVSELQVTVDFDAPVDATALQAGDLLVDGAAVATGVVLDDADTARFTIPSPAAGTHTLRIDAGAVSATDGTALGEWSRTFDVATDTQYMINHSPRLQLGDQPLVGFADSATDRVELLWQTMSAGSGTQDSFTVEYRLDGTAAPWMAAPATSQIPIPTGGRINHYTTITGLSYATDYEYHVRHLRADVVVDEYASSFRTRLAAGTQTAFSFAAYGDSADITDIQPFRDVQNRINIVDPAFAVLLGDNVYDSGTHNESDARFDPDLNPEAAAWTAGHIDYVGFGNHDVSSDGGQPGEDNFSVPIPVGGVTAPASVPAGEPPEHNYSFDYGSVHFVTFDTNSLNDATRLNEQLTWMEADLAATSAQWKIVFGHHPVTGSPDKSESAADNYYQQVVPRLLAAGVDVFLMGHSHTYHRTYPLLGHNNGVETLVLDTDNQYDQGTGLIQLVAGTGGKSLRSGSFTQFPFNAAGFSTSTTPPAEYGFAKFNVTPTQLTVSYIAADDGATLDQFTITAGTDTIPPSAAWATPQDNGPADLDPAVRSVRVTSTQPTFDIQVSDSSGVDDATVTAATVSVTKDAVPLVESTDFGFGYNAVTDIITLTSLGGDFSDGVYVVTLSGGTATIADTLGNSMSSTALTVEIAPASPGISVGAISGNTTEAGGTATFTVVLNIPPTADVAIGLSSSDTSEGSVAQSSVTFTPANWSTARTVTVTGVDDAADDGDVAYTIVTSAAISGDAKYNGLDAADVGVTNQDDDLPLVLLYFSLTNSATLSGISSSVQDEDIIAYDGVDFAMVFDGSDVGLSNLDINAFSILDDGSILMSFTSSSSLIGSLGSVDDSDIVRFEPTSTGDNTAGTFTWYLDGSDVGLSSSGEDIDALERLNDGTLLISTTGSISVTGASGSDEDLMAFSPSQLGTTTAGSWTTLFDGSDVGLSNSRGEDVDATAVGSDGRYYFSTVGDFVVSGASGADEDVFAFDVATTGSSTSGSFAMFVDGSTISLGSEDINAIDLPSGFSGPANQTPVATNDAYSTNEDTALNIVLTGSDVDGDLLTYSVVSGPTKGSLSGTAPELTYTPDADFNGSDSFTFRAHDGSVNSPTATVSITVNPVNDAPQANDDSYSLVADTTLNVAAPGVLGNDNDVDLDQLTAAVEMPPTNGSLTLNTNGSFDYTPNTGFTGVDSFTYKASDGVAASNVATVSLTVNSDLPPVLLYFSLTNSATLSGISSSVQDEDIIAYDGVDFAMVFDGSDVGLSNLDINAFSILDDGSILMSFTSSSSLIGSLGSVDDSDIVRFEPTSTGDNTAGTFTWYLDGSDVGLSSSGEDIDALERLNDGTLLISTTGSISVTGASGSDEDLMAFSPSQLGTTTAGSWTTLFDGSDVGLSNSRGEDVDATAVGSDGRYYFSTVGNFVVSGASGADEDVFAFDAATTGSSTSGSFAMFVDGSTISLGSEDINAIDLPSGSSGPANQTPVATNAAGPKLAHGVVNVGSNWSIVSLPNSYTEVVVVASPNYDSGSPPAVVRIRNAGPNSFEIRVAPAGPNSVGSMNVHYVAVEAGAYDVPGSYKLEAGIYESTVTDSPSRSWDGQSMAYQQSYSAPAVFAQVMTHNDSKWSVAWTSGSSSTSAPTSSSLTLGKHSGEDSDPDRQNEDVGYIILESNGSGTAEIDGFPYVVGLGADSIRGVDNSPPYSNSYNVMSNSKTAVVTQAGMDGYNGGWAFLYGNSPITPTDSTINIAIDEDQSADSERRHTSEQVVFWIIDPPVTQPTVAPLARTELVVRPSVQRAPAADRVTTRPASSSRSTAVEWLGADDRFRTVDPRATDAALSGWLKPELAEQDDEELRALAFALQDFLEQCKKT